MNFLNILVAGVLSFSSLAFSAERIAIDVSEVNAQQFLRYNFGRVFVNSMNRVIYQIRNTGNVIIEREGFSISGPGFDAYTTCPKMMLPGSVCDLDIRYWPAFEGRHYGRMQMLFTDRNDIIIDLVGEAFR